MELDEVDLGQVLYARVRETVPMGKRFRRFIKSREARNTQTCAGKLTVTALSDRASGGNYAYKAWRFGFQLERGPTKKGVSTSPPTGRGWERQR